MNNNFKALLHNLKNDRSEECCFDNHDIITEMVEIETGEDPLASVRRIFVR